MKKLPLILAIDTSCDDTSAAVTQGNAILSNVVASQTELHKQYGGVFPTVAKLAHKENISAVIQAALKRARITLAELDAVAVTQGPGLAPALEVGITAAKNLAAEQQLPLIPVNHVEGHMFSVLAHPASKTPEHPQYPVLAVVISGKQTHFILIHDVGKYEVIGRTLDDAAGECLDKIGRMVNLGYPAGATIEKFAKLGNPDAVEFPLPLTHVKTFDLSFSGLKTFARNYLDTHTQQGTVLLTQQEVYDFCASTQHAVFRHIIYKLEKVLTTYQVQEIWVGGGVAANSTLRKKLRQIVKKHSISRFRAPYTKKLCIDNAAMIGVVAGMRPTSIDPAELERKPRLQVGE